jgi:hypothetical protein
MIAIKHHGALEKLMSILALVKKEPIRSTDHLETEKVMERPQVLDGELSAKAISKPSKKIGSAGRQDDVVNIEQQVGGLGAVSEDKQRGVGARRLEAKLVEEGRDALVPGARRLLQAIQGAREQAHMLGVIDVDEAGGLLTVHLLGEVSMKKALEMSI